MSTNFFRLEAIESYLFLAPYAGNPLGFNRVVAIDGDESLASVTKLFDGALCAKAPTGGDWTGVFKAFWDETVVTDVTATIQCYAADESLKGGPIVQAIASGEAVEIAATLATGDFFSVIVESATAPDTTALTGRAFLGMTLLTESASTGTGTGTGTGAGTGTGTGITPTIRKALAVYDLPVTITHTNAAVTLPAVGSTAVFPVYSVEGFEVGDTVQIAQRAEEGHTVGMAVMELTTVGVNDLQGTILDRSSVPYISLAGHEFAADRTELTGQTRMPPAPSGATSMQLFPLQNPEMAWARHNETDPGQEVARLVSAEYSLVSYTQRVGGSEDIDGLTTLGAPIGIGGELEIHSDESPEVRIFCETPFRFRPMLKIIYR